jgi:large subunit ribosomal protein L14
LGPKSNARIQLSYKRFKERKMIQQQTILKVSDNSGAKTAKCIKVLGGFKKKYAKLGDIIIVSVQKLRNKSKNTSKVKKGEVYKALIIRTKTKYIKKDGTQIWFNENSITLLNKQENPIGTRVLGPMAKVLKKKQFQKILSISSGLI